MKTANLIYVIILCLGVAARAQQTPPDHPSSESNEKPVPPPGCLLNDAPEFSSWQVKFTYLDEPSKKDKPSSEQKPNFTDLERRAKEVLTTKTRKIVHEVTTYVTGKQSDRWYNGKILYQKDTNLSGWLFKEGLTFRGAYTDDSYSPLPACGFRDLDWINSKTYAGTIANGDRKYLIFVSQDAERLDLSNPAKQKQQLDFLSTVAYIDSETRLPVSVRINGALRTYQFTAPPSEMQNFPADLAAEVKRGEDARIRALQLAPRPY